MKCLELLHDLQEDMEDTSPCFPSMRMPCTGIFRPSSEKRFRREKLFGKTSATGGKGKSPTR